MRVKRIIPPGKVIAIKKENDYIELMNRSMRDMFFNALKVSIRDPRLAFFIIRTLIWQRMAERRRAYWEKRDLHVPPFMIASITRRCNLRCKGCYARAQHHSPGLEMSEEEWSRVIRESHDLGISIILLAGGEPLVRREFLNITGRFRDIIFPVFTNGLLLDEELIRKIKKQRNLVPVISIEGYEKYTDMRRGEGVYRHIKRVMERIKGSGIFFGSSLTITSQNFAEITGDDFISLLVESGCRVIFFVEYIPVEQGTEDLVIGKDQREELRRRLEELRRSYGSLFISFPGDEKLFGGCLSSGKGFVHISSQGDLEPCPFAPYSDTNLKSTSLKDALRSRLLHRIRESEERLKETEGGCALWTNREWIGSLLGSGDSAEDRVE